MEQQGSYRKFFLMLGVSYVVMYIVMYLNVAEFSHVYIGLTRLYMTALMVSLMALIMLGFMWAMYKDKRTNTLIIGGSILTFIVILTFVRTQTFVGDEQYMQAMIPHHSSAILFSQQANLKDPEVQQLAREIIDAQEREIAQMKEILARMKK